MRRNMEVSYNGATCLVYTNSQRNENVFKALSNELTESLARMSAGRWFQEALSPCQLISCYGGLDTTRWT